MASSLNSNIARFYDRSSALWESQWGIHMHHGYYNGQHKDPILAQVRMIEELLTFAGIENSPKHILDAGCGIGGSSFYLKEKWPSVRTIGLTLSPRQARRAGQLARQNKVEKSCRFLRADMTRPPLPDNSFDFIWSMESAEHAPDKDALFSTFFNLLQPGGHFACATWCHKETSDTLSGDEKKLLEKINRHFHLPRWVSGSMLAAAAERAGFVNLKHADWTEFVAPFWKQLWRIILKPKSIVATLAAGREALFAALTVRRMIKGYKQGLIRFVVLSGQKP